MKKVGCLVYKPNILPNWWIHLVFSVTWLEFALSSTKDPFARLFPSNSLLIFVKNDTNKVKSFEIEKLLNKYQVKKGKS